MDATSSDKLSFLSPCGYQDGSCGYCKDSDTSQRTPRSRGSLYATSQRLTVEHYQKLVHRGWRRSGNTLYKPDQVRSCCPHYAIRLPVAELRTSKDQRSTLHRWNRFVLGENYIKESAKLYPKTKEEKKRKHNEFDLISAVHGSEYTSINTPPEPDHRFEVTVESNEFTEEKYLLFEQYQRLVHKEPPSRISREGFKQFLCDSPLLQTEFRCDDGNILQCGSFHQCYRLDGRLIAISVIDLLPNAVSAVYFIYHLDFEKWSFGKLSALREAAMAQEGGYQNYNMGFYIHSCAKMRYKCDYKPQYLLDPDTYQWHVLDDSLKAKLDERKFVSPSRDSLIGPDCTKLEVMEVDIGNGYCESASSKPPALERYSTPSEACGSEDSLISFGMPGIMTRDEVNELLEEQTLFIAVPGRANPGKNKSQIIRPATDLLAWEDGPVTEKSGYIKQVIADLVAAIGPEVARESIIDFSK